MKRILWFAAIASVSLLVQTVSASVIGNMNEANCGGGGVKVDASTITWLPPAGLGGCIDSGVGTSLTWSGAGSLGAGATGTILNLTVGGGIVTGFMVFTGGASPQPTQTISFTLDSFGSAAPLTGSAGCATATANVGDSCSFDSTSPFILTNVGGGETSVSLVADGSVADPNALSQISYWSGSFSTQINQTPTAIYNAIIGGGSITSTQSAQFNVAVIPEPGTAAMLLIGGFLLASSARKRKRNM